MRVGAEVQRWGGAVGASDMVGRSAESRGPRAPTLRILQLSRNFNKICDGHGSTQLSLQSIVLLILQKYHMR